VKSFFRVVSTDDARRAIAALPPVGSESVAVAGAAGRVLAADVRAAEDMPHFDRANMDGYAVRAHDTFGASASVPAYLRLVGIVEMGQAPKLRVARGQAARISTGGMLPPGADAVVMVEYTDELEGDTLRGTPDGRTVEVQRGAAPWENVMRVGEDIARGATVFTQGRRLRPRDLGALAGIGVRRVKVHARPRLALLSTGDEIVAPGSRPKPGQVRNINAYSLQAMLAEAGAEVLDLGVVRDRREDLQAALAAGLRDADAVVLSGGSSVGTKDIALEVVQGFARSEILFHGISVAPGKPTILAKALGKPVLGLPGHPQSALLIFELFGAPLVRILGGESAAHAFRPARTVRATLARNIASKPGREDYTRVALVPSADGLLAQPMAGKSGAVFNLVQADGLVCVPASSEGLDEGTEVDVILL
jgi:molybdopterin molybdotransferase